jgi:hypothetical protein
MSLVAVPIIKERVLATQAIQQQKFNTSHNVVVEPCPVRTVVMLEVPQATKIAARIHHTLAHTLLMVLQRITTMF